MIVPVTLVAVSAVALGLYAVRRELARDVAEGWLRAEGVPAEVRFETLTLHGFTASLRAGPADDPDLVVRRAEVEYVVLWPWSKGGFEVRPVRVRLVSPVLRAKVENGELRLGTLDRLVREALKQPSKPGVRLPLVLAEDARLSLSTPYGPIHAHGDARYDDGRLVRLDARLAPTRLLGDDLSIELEDGDLHLETRGGRMHAVLRARAPGVETSEISVEDADYRVEADLPYPDTTRGRLKGAARVTAAVRADTMAISTGEARDAELNLDFDGVVEGGAKDLRVAGRANTAGRAGAVAGVGFEGRDGVLRLETQDLDVRGDGRALSWRARSRGEATLGKSRSGGAFLESARFRLDRADLSAAPGAAPAGDFAGRLEADRLTASDLTLARLEGDLRGRLNASGPSRLALTGALSSGRGAWKGLGAPDRSDSPDAAALKRAAANFRLSAPALTWVTGDRGSTFTLGAPLQLIAADGGTLRLTPRAGRAVYAGREGQGGGGFDLAMGGGLPEGAVHVVDYSTKDGRLRAAVDGHLAFSLGSLRSARIETAGEVAYAGGAWTLTSPRCASLIAERVALGGDDVVAFAGRLCSDGGPLATVSGDGWRLSGRLEGLQGRVPTQYVHLTGGAGEAEFYGRGRGASARLRLSALQLIDTAEERRFNPLSMTGEARLSADRWSGRFEVFADGARVGQATLAHDVGTGRGRVQLETGDLAFRRGGLQPAAISPLGERLGQVQGKARFSGEIDWTMTGNRSRGRVELAGLDMNTPLGVAHGVRGVIDLTSLSPLISAPNQTLEAPLIDGLVPIEQARATYRIESDRVVVDDARFAAAGAAVTFEPTVLPLTDGAIHGAVRFDELRLDELAKAGPYAEKIDFDAVVRGRLPFVVDAGGLRVVDGRLSAVGPGRVSIRREALTQAAAGAGAGVPAPVGVQSLAYAAMEDLAFDKLDAEVNSLPDGRLGVLFHVKGRHAPPTPTELRLSLPELIRRDFLKKPLPLPSGTEVDLTLDTTVNLGDILSDLRTRGRPNEPAGARAR